MAWNQLSEMLEVLDSMAEAQGMDDRFSIEETVRAVFGDSVEIVEFTPYGEDK